MIARLKIDAIRLPCLETCRRLLRPRLRFPTIIERVFEFPEILKNVLVFHEVLALDQVLRRCVKAKPTQRGTIRYPKQQSYSGATISSTNTLLDRHHCLLRDHFAGRDSKARHLDRATRRTGCVSVF